MPSHAKAKRVQLDTIQALAIRLDGPGNKAWVDWRRTLTSTVVGTTYVPDRQKTSSFFPMDYIQLGPGWAGLIQQAARVRSVWARAVCVIRREISGWQWLAAAVPNIQLY